MTVAAFQTSSMLKQAPEGDNNRKGKMPRTVQMNDFHEMISTCFDQKLQRYDG